MDQIKTGKLIAKLRKEKGLTQSQLGEMVGVGDRAVSKWERGIHCPNVAIINELSEILGISTNELLDGEIFENITDVGVSSNDEINLSEIEDENISVENTDEEETKDNVNKLQFNKYLFFIPILLVLIVGISLFFLINNRSSMYMLAASNDEYAIEGNIIFSSNKMYVNIDKIVFYDKSLDDTFINNYSYSLLNGIKLIFRSGYNGEYNLLDKEITIGKLLENFKISFYEKVNDKKDIRKIIDNGLILKISFFDQNNNLISKEIKMMLQKAK